MAVNKVNTMAVDALAICFTRSSAAILEGDLNDLSVDKWQKIQINFNVSWNYYSLTRVDSSGDLRNRYDIVQHVYRHHVCVHLALGKWTQD